MRELIEALRAYDLRKYRISLVVFVTTISIMGVFIVGSAQKSVQSKQLLGVILGFLAMLIISLFDYHVVLKFYWLLYAINIVFLISVLLFGVNVNGATRWLNLGFFQFQPSDLTKIILILFYARMLRKSDEEISDIKFIIEAVGLVLPSLALIYKQPNLSNTICIALTFCALYFIAGLSARFISRMAMIIIPLAVIFFIIVIQPNQFLIHDYQQNRILAWLDPEEYESDEAYQQLNSLMAIGSGQLTGKGYNSDSAESVKNGNFISEPQTDFIFAIVGEELGFVGCCAIIILLLLIVVSCISVGMRAPDKSGRIIASGVGALIGIQTFINIAVATMLFPNTGISLPFVSYGLTSVVSFYMGIGFVLNVGLQGVDHTLEEKSI